MNITFILLLVFGAALAFFFKNLLSVNSTGLRKSAWELSVILLAASLDSLVAASILSEALPHFLYLSLPLRFLIVHYLRPFTAGNPSPAKSWHPYILPVLCLIALAPVYGLDAAQKVSLIYQAPLTVLVARWSTIAYFVWFSFRHRFPVPGGSQRFSLMAIAFLSYTTLQALGTIAGDFYPALDLMASFILLAAVWTTIVKADRQRKSAFSALADRIEQLMVDKKLFTDHSLSLSKVASELQTTPNKVSAALNQARSTNFNDYINQFRVKEAQRLLSDESNHIYTLESIGKMAGFSSSTTFNAAFKKLTGKTPKAFKLLPES
jgi:AraC-like DNA-binding protein